MPILVLDECMILLNSLRVLMLASLLAAPVVIAEDSVKPIDPSTHDGQIHVACVGDSITQGNKRGDYPSQLQEMLGEKWKVMNFGHSGFTLLKKGDRSYWKSPRYEKALASEPHVVIIKLGTNDTKPQNWKFKEEFEADYRALIESFQKLKTQPKIYLCLPCPVIGEGNWGINEAGIQEQMPILKSLVKEMGLGLIDIHGAFDGKDALIPDRVHPNKEGYGVMASTIFQALTGKPAPEMAKP